MGILNRPAASTWTTSFVAHAMNKVLAGGICEPDNLLGFGAPLLVKGSAIRAHCGQASAEFPENGEPYALINCRKCPFCLLWGSTRLLGSMDTEISPCSYFIFAVVVRRPRMAALHQPASVQVDYQPGRAVSPRIPCRCSSA